MTPLISPPADLLRNAIFILGLALEDRVPDHADIRRAHLLIQGALEQLGEPSAAAIQAATAWVDAGNPRALREARDLAAAVIAAQLTGTP